MAEVGPPIVLAKSWLHFGVISPWPPGNVMVLQSFFDSHDHETSEEYC